MSDDDDREHAKLVRSLRLKSDAGALRNLVNPEHIKHVVLEAGDMVHRGVRSATVAFKVAHGGYTPHGTTVVDKDPF